MEYEKSNSEELFTEKITNEISCIIPSAGLSSRMSCWKGELLSLEGIPFMEKAVRTALTSCRDVIVVAGKQVAKVRRILSAYPGICIIENPDYEKGMLSSIQAGLAGIGGDFFVLPMDMPLIGPEHLDQIVSRHDKRKITRPVYDSIPGHPVYFPGLWKQRILDMKGRSLMKHLQDDDQLLIPWQDSSVILDIDTDISYDSYINK